MGHGRFCWIAPGRTCKFSASREDRDVLRRCHLSPLTPSPHDGRPRSFIHRQGQHSRATPEMPWVNGNTTRYEISHCRGTFTAAPSNGGKSGEVEFALPLDRDVEGCRRRRVFRAFLVCSTARLQVTLCELVEMEPRLVNARTATKCEYEEMISRAAVFRRQVVQVLCITTGLSRSSGGQNECIQSAPPCTLRACTSHLWLTVISTLMCSSPGRKKVFEMRTRWLRVHGEICTQT